MIRPLVRGALTGLAVIALAAGMWRTRAALEEQLTAPGAGIAQRRLAGSELAAAPVARRPVRVVVLDGLTRADARGPALDALCRAGMELLVDVGFPTKSLPVQSVLWTGLTAQQSGVAMRNQLPAPLEGALPARVPGAVAVVESFPSIARAVGFPVVIESRAELAARAGAAVAGDAPLVMVHVLAIDEAGHRGGRDAAYRAAVARADGLLGELVAAAPGAAWIVLSDHGHRAGGGHGDVEDDVRRVRACVTPRPPGAPPAGEVHLVDVSRHLHDVLGVTMSPRAVGRPLSSASRTLDRDATLPRIATWSWLAALAVAIAGAAAAWRWGRPRAAAFGVLLIFDGYVIACGFPTLSTRSPDVALALGGALALGLFFLPGRNHPARVMALGLPAVAAVVAGGFLTGFPSTMAGGPPARLPYVTAAWQVLAGLSTVPLLFCGGLAVWLLSGPRTTPRPELGRSSSGGSDQRVRAPDSGASP